MATRKIDLQCAGFGIVTWDNYIPRLGYRWIHISSARVEVFKEGLGRCSEAEAFFRC